jgi:hypothetical protein
VNAVYGLRDRGAYVTATKLVSGSVAFGRAIRIAPIDDEMTDGKLREAFPDLSLMDDADLLRLRAELHAELKRRGLSRSVGQLAEKLAIDYFNRTPGCPKLLEAPTNTANVDALSRRGDRYSIKGALDTRKTGTIYPNEDEPNRQLFEYLLIVQLNNDWTLQAIYEFDWPTFVKCRSWDKRMNAWYVGLAARTLAQANRRYAPAD